MNGTSQSLMLCLLKFTSSLPDGRSENDIWCGQLAKPPRERPLLIVRALTVEPRLLAEETEVMFPFMWIVPPYFLHIPRNPSCTSLEMWYLSVTFSIMCSHYSFSPQTCHCCILYRAVSFAVYLQQRVGIFNQFYQVIHAPSYKLNMSKTMYDKE